MDMAISNMNAAGQVVPAITSPGSAAGTSPPEATSAQASQEPSPVRGEAAKQLLQEVQSQMDSMNISLSFSIYGKKGDEICIIVTDKDTGKVIREIHPKEIQDLQTKLGEIMGLIFNHSV